MGFIIGWSPFIINVIFAFAAKEYEALFFTPISIFIGMLLLYKYDNSKMNDLKKHGKQNTKEYKKYKTDADIGKVMITGSVIKGIKDTHKYIKDIADVDHNPKL